MAMNIKPICGISEFPYLNFVYVNNNDDENIPISYSQVEIVQTNNVIELCDQIIEAFHEQYIFGKYILHCVSISPRSNIFIDTENVLSCRIFFNLQSRHMGI